MCWKVERLVDRAAAMEDGDVTSRGRARIRGESGRYEREEGLRAVAMMEWVVVLKISRARDFPMPDEEPVTLWLLVDIFPSFFFYFFPIPSQVEEKTY